MPEDSGDERSVDKTYDPNEQQLEGYNFVKTLGKGNFGKVKLGVHVLTGEYVAIKILEKDLIFEKADIERISREIKIMKLIRHTNIVQLYEIIEKPKRLYLIMEYADGGDLFDLIVKNERLSEKSALNYFAQILLGLNYLHGKGVAHRDMKPENILISQGKIKIADFGLGNFFTQGQMLKTACGSPCYAAPEMLQRVPYDPQKADIWSSGIILYAMSCGYLPFEDDVTTKLYEKIKNNTPRYPKFLSEGLKDILKRVLDKNPQSRPSIALLKDDLLIRPQIEAEKVYEFEVDNQKLMRVCDIYGINEQEKLASYLRKNKHNNLTTIYYLANKRATEEGANKLGDEKHQSGSGSHNQNEQPHDNVSHISINERMQQHGNDNNQSGASNPEIYSQNLFTHTQSIIENPPSTIAGDLQQVQQRVQDNKKSSSEVDSKSKGQGRSQNQEQPFNDSPLVDINQPAHTEEFTPAEDSEKSARQAGAKALEKMEKKETFHLQIKKENNTKGPKVQKQIKWEVAQSQKSQIASKQQKNNESTCQVKRVNESAEKNINNKDESIHRKNPLNESVGPKQKTSRIVKQAANQLVRQPKNSNSNKITQVKEATQQKMSQVANTEKPSMPRPNKGQWQQSKFQDSCSDVGKNIGRKPRMVKTGRVEIVKASEGENNRKMPALYERSSSRDKTISTKKIIGRLVSSEPFLIDASRVVLCAWPTLNSILVERGAEGRIEYFGYGKSCLYISRCSIRGIRSIKEIIDKINCGQLS